MRTIRTTATLVLLWTLAGTALVALAPLPLAVGYRLAIGALIGALLGWAIWLFRERDP